MHNSKPLLIHQGSYCNVYRKEKFVIKEINLNNSSNEDVLFFIQLVFKYKSLLDRWIKTPNIFQIQITPLHKRAIKLIFKEEFCGENIRDLYVKKHIASGNLLYLRSKFCLWQIPKVVYIDAHPLNFTIYKGNIYFVDYIPPIMALVTNKTFLLNNFSIFNHRSRDQIERRIWRYTTKEGRISKYDHYLKTKILANITPQPARHLAVCS